MMPCCKKKNRRQGSSGQIPSQGSLKVLAAQTLKIASINGLGDADKLETELENEIRWEESRRPPTEIIDRFRRRGEEILHSKPVLLFVVALNIIDCLLVMGELTLDFHHVSYSYVAQKDHTEDFLHKLKADSEYPPLKALHNVEDHNLTVLFNSVLEGFVVWNASRYTGTSVAHDCMAIQTQYSAANYTGGSNVLTSLVEFGRKQPVRAMPPMNKEKYDSEKIGHGMHYASISILTVLVAETLLKIACVGRRFLKKKMEIFDAIVILVSFILDIIFVEGLTNLHMEKYVIILSFLLPWRVLRVLNSLIVAVMDQHRFHLKLLYKQKRKINRNYQEASEQVNTLEKQVEILKTLCSSRGVHEWEVNKAIGQTLTPNGHGGGLKALSKLVFQAAESFAPLSSPRHNKHSTNTLSPESAASAPTFSFFRCNGDMEHGSSNGHAHPLRGGSSLVEDETKAAPKEKTVDSDVTEGGMTNDVRAASEREQEGKETAVTAEVEAEEGTRTSDSECSVPGLKFYLSRDSSVDSVDSVTSPSDGQPAVDDHDETVTRL
ncbi:uncharacterized protein [Littorina saxatilis]|uniref:uncharacterized protein n=1 Tax=Littorina saxatilis TaxID=31220 RepID=UPI0038B5126B